MVRNLQSMWELVLASVKECWSTKKNIIVFLWQCLTLFMPATNPWRWLLSLPLASCKLECGCCCIFWWAVALEWKPMSWPSLHFAPRSCDRDSGCRCLYNGLAQNLGLIVVHFSTPTVRCWWSPWRVIWQLGTANLWWKWWSDTLWATLIRLSTAFIMLLPLMCYCGVFSATSLSRDYDCAHCYVTFILFLWRFLCNLIDMWLFLMVCFWISSRLVSVMLLSLDKAFAFWLCTGA